MASSCENCHELSFNAILIEGVNGDLWVIALQGLMPNIC